MSYNISFFSADDEENHNHIFTCYKSPLPNKGDKVWYQKSTKDITIQYEVTRIDHSYNEYNLPDGICYRAEIYIKEIKE